MIFRLIAHEYLSWHVFGIGAFSHKLAEPFTSVSLLCLFNLSSKKPFLCINCQPIVHYCLAQTVHWGHQPERNVGYGYTMLYCAASQAVVGSAGPVRTIQDSGNKSLTAHSVISWRAAQSMGFLHLIKVDQSLRPCFHVSN